MDLLPNHQEHRFWINGRVMDAMGALLEEQSRGIVYYIDSDNLRPLCRGDSVSLKPVPPECEFICFPFPSNLSDVRDVQVYQWRLLVLDVKQQKLVIFCSKARGRGQVSGRVH